jgi:hypothetical protein
VRRIPGLFLLVRYCLLAICRCGIIICTGPRSDAGGGLVRKSLERLTSQPNSVFTFADNVVAIRSQLPTLLHEQCRAVRSP